MNIRSRVSRVVGLLAALALAGGYEVLDIPTGASADSVGATIAAIANANLGKMACSTNSAGGVGYYSSCTGAGGRPELWCSDFARWVWSQAGIDVSNLDAWAPNFTTDGVHSIPQVGDAVLFSKDGTAGGVDHVAIVTQVNNGTIVSVGGDENGSGDDPQWASTSTVAQDGPHSSAVGAPPGLAGPVFGYVTPPTGGAPTPPPPSSGKPANAVWVNTFATATGYSDTGESTSVGSLYAGLNYVFCKATGARVGSDSEYNHWWLWTDLDTGGRGYVSAYYLKGEGNDQATDTSGRDIPVCAGTSGDGKYWVNTFAAATAYTTPGGGTVAGRLNAGPSYILCRVWGPIVRAEDGYNHWWLWTDLDTGGRGYVSAYYLKGEGNDQATDTSGRDIPAC